MIGPFSSNSLGAGLPVSGSSMPRAAPPRSDRTALSNDAVILTLDAETAALFAPQGPASEWPKWTLRERAVAKLRELWDAGKKS